jgi:hypothetical protein
LEYCAKLETHLGEVRRRFEEITATESKEGITWPSIDWEDVGIRIGEAREKFLTSLSEVAQDLETLEVSKYPDYFGQLYSTAAQECYSALAQGLDTRFNRLFPQFFSIALRGVRRIVAQIGGSADVKQLLMSDPITDLMDLSGFAFAYSELDGRRSYHDTVRSQWDRYFDQTTEPERTQKLQGFALWTRPVLRTTSRESVRMGWKAAL